MQTFLPFSSFSESAKHLDYRRLGKQRVETKQILSCLGAIPTDKPYKAWRNHPATEMWRGFEGCLASYGAAMSWHWRERGYKDNLLPEFLDVMDQTGYCEDNPNHQPPWLGDKRLHDSHQSRLVQKMPEYYTLFGWTITYPDYWWPTRQG